MNTGSCTTLSNVLGLNVSKVLTGLLVGTAILNPMFAEFAVAKEDKGGGGGALKAFHTTPATVQIENIGALTYHAKKAVLLSNGLVEQPKKSCSFPVIDKIAGLSLRYSIASGRATISGRVQVAGETKSVDATAYMRFYENKNKVMIQPDFRSRPVLQFRDEQFKPFLIGFDKYLQQNSGDWFGLDISRRVRLFETDRLVFETWERTQEATFRGAAQLRGSSFSLKFREAKDQAMCIGDGPLPMLAAGSRIMDTLMGREIQPNAKSQQTTNLLNVVAEYELDDTESNRTEVSKLQALAVEKAQVIKALNDQAVNSAIQARAAGNVNADPGQYLDCTAVAEAGRYLERIHSVLPIDAAFDVLPGPDQPAMLCYAQWRQWVTEGLK